MSRFRIGIDTGGTFNDFVIFNETSKEFSVFKLPSTPRDPSGAVKEGIRELFNRGILPDEISFLSHGTTVGTNALLEDKGAKAGVLLTEGFRGINDIDQSTASAAAMYDVYYPMRKSLLPPRMCQEIRERTDYKGNILTPLDRGQARLAIDRIMKQQAVESLAICLLFSFMNPHHELEVARLTRDMYPNLPVSLSSEVLPQIREYQRLCTTIVQAMMLPVLSKYLKSLDEYFVTAGITTGQRYIMQCNGGVTTFAMGPAKAVSSCLSGPAAGVIAGVQIASQAGFDNVITLDMGGTSCDIALVEHGQPQFSSKGKVGQWEIFIPMVDINTIGAGGGTIGWLDKMGNFRVGPQSAGAEPGPACYDKGGEDPTVTDANIVLGHLDPDYFLGGKIKLNKQKAEEAIKRKIAKPLGLDLLEAAQGIVHIINTNMEQGIKVVSMERGYDLRDFVLVAFGGCGPVHAVMLAADLDIPKVLIPPAPGLTAAMGLLMADVKHDYVQSRLAPLATVNVTEINRLLRELAQKAVADLKDEGFSEKEIRLDYYLDLRYSGQGYELTIPAPGQELKTSDLQDMRSLFDQYHEKLFGHKAEKAPVELVNGRVVSRVGIPTLELPKRGPAQHGVEKARVGQRYVCFDLHNGKIPCNVYDRDLLGAGHTIVGPAIIAQMDSTTVVCPGQVARADDYGNIIISLKEGDNR